MGIQNFFGYFFKESNNLKPNKKFIIEETIDQNVTKFYVDFVSIIHDILAENKEIDDGTDEANDIIIQKVIDRLATLFSYYPNAKKLVFFEAIPTIAKIKEQYFRRIIRKIQNDVELDLKKRLRCEVVPRFDQQNFAIDSDFLKKVVLAIKDNFNDIENIEIFDYSDSSMGEAEHKIIRHIVNINFESNDVLVVASPDGDVFLLSAILTNILSHKHNKNITINTLRRSDDVPDRKFYKIDTQKFIKFLLSKIDSKKNKFETINDITYVFNLIGDDFIPVFDKFKTAHAKDIFPVIFKALKNLEYDEVLQYDGDKFTVNKNNLLKIFEELEKSQPANTKLFKREYKYILPVGEPMQLNKLLFTVLQDAFIKGYYFYERALKSNHNNFYLTNLNYNKNFTNANSKFLVFNTEKKDNQEQYVITINKSIYKTVSMLEIDKAKDHSEQNDQDKISNYFEGYQFILDLYFNTPGVVKNNFWYYRFNSSPTLSETIEWLKNNELPSYVPPSYENQIEYFNVDQYKKFLQKLIDSNYEQLLPNNKTSLSYDDLVEIDSSSNKLTNRIFNCFEKKYINKCEIKREHFFDPIEFIKNEQKGGKVINDYYSQYLKYKKKYLKLKRQKN